MRIIYLVLALALLSLKVSAEETAWEILDELGQYYGIDANGYIADGKDFMDWHSNESILGPISYADIQNIIMNNPQGTSSTGATVAGLGAQLLDMWIDGDNYTTVDVEYKNTPVLVFESLTGPFLLNGSHTTFNATHSFEEQKTRIFWPTAIHEETCSRQEYVPRTCYWDTGLAYECGKLETKTFERVYEKAVKISKFTGNSWVSIYDNSSNYLFDTGNNGGNVSIYANKSLTDDVGSVFGHKYKIEVRKKGGNCGTSWESSYDSTIVMDVDSDMDFHYDRIPGLYYNKVQAPLVAELFADF